MKSFNLPLFGAVLFAIVLCVFIAVQRLKMDTDIVRSLPADSPVVSDALDIFSKHPIHDQIAVDIILNVDDSALLLDSAEFVEKEFTASGIFRQVGNGEIAALIPKLALYAVENLPLLFSASELEEEIAPRLNTNFIQTRLQESLQKLSSLEGIGQGQFIASDPLGFMEPIMARMALQTPFAHAEIRKGFVLSADHRHLLVTARPKASGTDTAPARQLAELIRRVEQKVNNRYGEGGKIVSLTPVGAYRAALDNEQIIRHDVNFALILSMLGIGLLLFIAFPRPLIGLLSLLPAVFGTAVSLLVFSFFHPSISIMVLGFGGAIISITVDQGIAYLLFLDRRRRTRGRDASHEVRSVGLLAVLTTCAAFLTLGLSGFPVFVQLGQFTAMGVLFSFLFVHFIFPALTPMLNASRRGKLPLQYFVDALYSTGRVGFCGAVLLALVLVFYARPEFQVSLESMNTVSQETLAADARFTSVWGDMSKRTVLMLSAASVEDLQRQNDALLAQVEGDITGKMLDRSFVPSMLFPGVKRARENLRAWRSFWTPEKLKQLQYTLQTSAEILGFSSNAFSVFLAKLAADNFPELEKIPAAFFPLLGITETDGRFHQFVNISPGENYSSEKFFGQYHSRGKIFDSPYFSEQLAEILFSSFSTMFVVIAVSIVVFLLVFYASWQLTLITLLPPVFSYICTLGTMKLINHPLDIPGLMLSIVILGMGIDYSIFFVRAHQRYRNPHHSAFGLIRMAVFMAGVSTLIGFAVLCFAEHGLLRSIGITSLLGIGYSLLGAFLLLPPILRRYFSENTGQHGENYSVEQRVRNRYRLLEAYPRMFARFKLQYDPLFADLGQLLAQKKNDIRKILDIGCGYGVPGCYCLELCKNAKLIAFDPDPERVRVAALAAGDRGEAVIGVAPQLPDAADGADLALILDMLHYLDDASVLALFSNCAKRLADDGQLLVRYVIRPPQSPSFSWKLEDFRARSSGSGPYYRSIEDMGELIEKSGFSLLTNSISKADVELVWLLGEVVTR
ncbi:MAG: MMPL family protein [Desulfocapsa sp.]|nr:MAG: MMPL family protein [Desulfocapsa sp.]